MKWLFNRMCSVVVIALTLQISGCSSRLDIDAERTVIAQVISDHIGWFKNKDFQLLFSTCAQDSNFFMFQLDSKSTIRGFKQFEEYSVLWQNPDAHYTRHELHDLKIDFSRSGDVAWFSNILEDCGEYKGKDYCWKDTRWTGVLEKREGKWVIVHEHFSRAIDLVAEEVRAAMDSKK